MELAELVKQPNYVSCCRFKKRLLIWNKSFLIQPLPVLLTFSLLLAADKQTLMLKYC